MIVFLLLAYAALSLIPAWMLMLLLGALHHDVSSQVPALGFWQTILVTCTIGVIGGIFKPPSISKEK